MQTAFELEDERLLDQIQGGSTPPRALGAYLEEVKKMESKAFRIVLVIRHTSMVGNLVVFDFGG